MIFWIFAVITLGAVLVAAFALNLKRAILALWIAGFGAGGLYLTVGAETLAIVQWIVSTLIAISFVFFAVMFGEFGNSTAQFHPPRKNERTAGKLFTPAIFRRDTIQGRKGALLVLAAFALGAAFGVAIWFGASHLPAGNLAVPAEGNDLISLGKRLTEEHFLSLEVLALTLFLVLVGGGVVARPDQIKTKKTGGDA